MRRLLPLLLLLTLLGHAPTHAVAAPAEGRARIDVLVLRGRAPVAAKLELRRVEGLLELVVAEQAGLGSTNVEASRHWLARQDARPVVARAEASSEGRARFAALPIGLYEVVARDGDALEARSVVALEADGQHVNAVVRLVAGEETLEGRLRYADGRPFQGFVVLGRSDYRRDDVPCLEGAWERAVDAEGRFRLAGLPPGELAIAALRPGRMRAELGKVRLPRRDAWEGTAPDEGGSPVRTIVDLESGRAVGGVEVFVRARDETGPTTLFRLEADSDGRVQLPAAAIGMELTCVAPGYAPAFARTRADAATALGLDRTARMEGVVLDPHGSPVPGVRVRLASILPAGVVSPFSEAAFASSRTDATGRYVVEGLPPLETVAWVDDAAWTSAAPWRHDHEGFTPYAVTLDRGVKPRHVHRVEPAGEVSGRVRDESGQGIEGALVWSEHDHYDYTSVRVTSTDASGRFRLGGFARSGLHRIHVLAPDGRWGSRDDVAVGMDTADVTLPRAAERWLEVRVIDDVAGLAVAGAEIRVDTSSDGVRYRSRPGVRTSFQTSADGSAWIGPLGREKIRLGARAEGHADPPWPTIEAAEGGPIQLVVGPRTWTLRGRVAAGPGERLPSGLQLVRSDPGEPPIGALKDGGTKVRVQVDGAFEIGGLMPGRYVLRASGTIDDRIFEGQAHVEAGSENVAIRLREVSRGVPRTWRFRVQTHDARPVPRATLWVEEDAPPEEQEFEEVQVHDGEATYVARDARVGLLLRVVACEAQAHSGRALPYGLGIAGNVEPGAEPEVIELPPERALRGRVLGPDGLPLAGVRVRTDVLVERGTTPREGLELRRTAVTLDDGSFRVGGRSESPYATRLRFAVPADCAREPSLVLPSEPYVPIEVRLVLAVRGSLRVVDELGAALPECAVSIEPNEGDFWTFDDNEEIEGFYSGPGHVHKATDAAGRAGFTRLDPRLGYPLFVDPPKTRPDLEGVHLPAWRPRAEEDTIVLRRVPK